MANGIKLAAAGREPNATYFRSGTSQWQRHGASRPARGDQFSSKKPGGLRRTAANKKSLPAKVGGIGREPSSMALTLFARFAGRLAPHRCHADLTIFARFARDSQNALARAQ